MTLGNAAAAHVRLIVWCKACAHRSEPDPANHARWFGPDTTVPEWRARLVCSKCGDDAVLAVDQDRGRKAELADAAGDLRDLRLGMRPRLRAIAPGAGYRAGIPIRDDLVVVHREPGHRLVGAEMARDLDTVRVGPFFRPAKSKRSSFSSANSDPSRDTTSAMYFGRCAVAGIGDQRLDGAHDDLVGHLHRSASQPAFSASLLSAMT
jgi:hypothetical protein